MSVTPEALAPQDAPVSPAEAQPDGAEPKPENEAAPSAAVASKPSETIEPETNRLNERFGELTRLRRDAERDRDHWRELALRNQKPEAPTQTPLAEKVKTLADFNFDEVQHHAYTVQQAAKAATEAAKRELKAEQERETKQKRIAEYVKRAGEFSKDKPDFRDVAEHAPISDSIADTLIGLESGPELAYYLGKNPDVAANLNAIPQYAAAYELGLIAARLKYEREAVSKAKAALSQAPPPAAKIEATGEAGVVKVDSADSDQLTDAEWARRRNAQELAKKRKARGG